MESFLRWSGAATPTTASILKARWREPGVTAFSDSSPAPSRTAGPRSLAPAARRPQLRCRSRPRARRAASLRCGPRRRRGRPTVAGGSALEVELVAQVGLGDGRSAHVPWLRELPDPLTRVSWTGCVRVAPSRAEALGVGTATT